MDQKGEMKKQYTKYDRAINLWIMCWFSIGFFFLLHTCQKQSYEKNKQRIPDEIQEDFKNI